MCRTLIVEDNDTYRQTLRGLLDSRFTSMAFEEAKDGNEALKKIKDFLPDLVFMDIKLHEESGLELTKKIRGSFPNIIVVILTSYDLPEYREAAKLCGANHFVSKVSSTAEEILALVESILSDLKHAKMTL
jgi:CheY-like chemotaxis protein